MRRISSHVPFGVLVALLASLLTAGGCATTVRPEAKPLDPVPVFLTDYGVHSSLMMPTPDGRYVEYSFGDFGYAALNHGGPHNALGALLVSNQSGIGRRFLTVRPGEETPRPAWAPKSFQKFYANRFEVYGIVKELDLRYRRGAGEQDPVHNPITDAVFVKDTEHYGITNNCNHMTARILREMGCVVRGNTGVSSFKIVGKQQLPPQVDVGTYADAAPSRVAPEPVRASSPARTAAYTKIDLGE